MAILIDDGVLAAPIRVPLTEGWVASSIPVEVRHHLQATDVGPGDIALISTAEVTRAAETHVVAPDVAVVVEGIGDIVMRTPVRPDGVEETPIRLIDISSTGEMLIRALLRPFFGITASTFVTSDEDAEATKAEVAIVEGLDALHEPEAGFQSDLAQAWYILTGTNLVSHVVIIGLEAQARGIGDEAVAILAQAAEVGAERKRDVRSAIAGDADVDREKLAELTNNLRFSLTPTDRGSLTNLIARGTWGSRFPRRNPVFRDTLPDDLQTPITTEDNA